MLLIMSLVNLDWNICPELSAPALRGGGRIPMSIELQPL